MVLVYNVTSLKSFENLNYWYNFIKKNIDPVFPEGQDWETYNKVALAIDGINESDIPEYVTIDDLKDIK